MMDDVSNALALIQRKRSEVPTSKGILVGVTGIDGCGKGYMTGRIVSELQRLGFKAVGINIDGWLNLPQTKALQQNLPSRALL